MSVTPHPDKKRISVIINNANFFIVSPKIKKCVPLRDTPKNIPLNVTTHFCPRQRGERIRFYQKAVFPLEMGIYSKMCGAHIIHQNPVNVNMDFGISPRESERE